MIRLVFVMLVATLAACAVEGDCAPDACESLQSPATTFRADVMPILQTSCTFSSCHGGGNGGLRLGNDADANVEALVGVAAKQLPSMKRVEPGKPALSYVVRKLDPDAHAALSGCDPDCGELMPQNGDPLPESERDTIRRWIAQGAKND